MTHEKLSQLAERLMEIPGQTAEAQTQILDRSTEAQKIQAEITKREAEIRSEIAGEIDGAGKKVYSNEDTRKAAFLERTSNSIDLIQLREEFETVQTKVQIFKIDYEELSNEQRNIRTLLYFFGKGGEE